MKSQFIFNAPVIPTLEIDASKASNALTLYKTLHKNFEVTYALVLGSRNLNSKPSEDFNCQS